MATSLSLTSLKVGQDAIITTLVVQNDLLLRLAAMGVRAGKRIKLLRSAAFSGPLHVRIGTTDLILRRKEAEFIHVSAEA